MTFLMFVSALKKLRCQVDPLMYGGTDMTAVYIGSHWIATISESQAGISTSSTVPDDSKRADKIMKLVHTYSRTPIEERNFKAGVHELKLKKYFNRKRRK